MLKVTKFGGSSMADAGQLRKVRDIVLADKERRVVIVSAAGKRFSGDHKLTDLLYLCYAHVQYGVPCDPVFEQITSRYIEIRDELQLDLDLETEFAELKQRLDAKEVSQDELVSRGEYFSAKLMAAFLGFAFVDAADWIRFNMDGTVDKEFRSVMNIPFVTESKELDAEVVAYTKKAGFDNLKGHKSVGGLRASTYNAMPIEGVEALVECLKKFEAEHQ